MAKSHLSCLWQWYLLHGILLKLSLWLWEMNLSILSKAAPTFHLLYIIVHYSHLSLYSASVTFFCLWCKALNQRLLVQYIYMICSVCTKICGWFSSVTLVLLTFLLLTFLIVSVESEFQYQNSWSTLPVGGKKQK